MFVSFISSGESEWVIVCVVSLQEFGYFCLDLGCEVFSCFRIVHGDLDGCESHKGGLECRWSGEAHVDANPHWAVVYARDGLPEAVVSDATRYNLIIVRVSQAMINCTNIRGPFKVCKRRYVVRLDFFVPCGMET